MQIGPKAIGTNLLWKHTTRVDGNSLGFMNVSKLFLLHWLKTYNNAIFLHTFIKPFTSIVKIQ